MEETLPTQPAETMLCNSCYTKVADTDTFCDNCGYPLKGTELEQQNFITNRNVKEIDLEDYNKQITRAGTALYWIAGLETLGGLLLFAVDKNVNDIIGSIIVAIIFIALGAWSRKKPLAAIISGASLYAILVVLSAIQNPLSILSGVIWKIIIVGAFARGIKAAIEAEKIRKELNV